ncbi:MAG: sialidase family protein, partial [Planctomycetia bacterium]|nr:sialidase family protein [Planctomycetia bacterium]
LVCTLFTYPAGNTDSEAIDPAKGPRMGVVRSLDGGKTWEQEPHRMPGFLMDATDGPVVELADHSILLAGEGKEKSGRFAIGVFRSTDRGATWQRLATIRADHDQYEPSLVQLKTGEMVMISRPEGDIAWSSDQGKTWTEPVTFGIRLFAPTLLVLPDGTLLCHYGSYNQGGLRAMFSTDGGRTWVVPADRAGFAVDGTYGYSRSCLMPDGSLPDPGNPVKGLGASYE